MPRSAIDNDSPDYILPASEIPKVLVSLARGVASSERAAVPDSDRALRASLEAEIDWSGADLEVDTPEEPPFGKPSGFSCPECNGVLWEIPAGDIPRFRCRVGHGYAAASLLSEQGAAVEAAMWTAVRVLEERAALTRRLAAHARRRDHRHSATSFERQASESERRADLLRDVLRQLEPLHDVYPEEAGEPPAG
jgi:two-component system chemotaxis response regulator CheB